MAVKIEENPAKSLSGGIFHDKLFGKGAKK
jgi:hypothetical protein